MLWPPIYFYPDLSFFAKINVQNKELRRSQKKMAVHLGLSTLKKYNLEKKLPEIILEET